MMRRMHRLLNKYLFLFNVGGLLYVLIELIWRGWSHWTMFILGGLCFIYLGPFNEVLRWDTPLWQQILIGAVGITALEFLTGCIVNLWLGWNATCHVTFWGRFVRNICCYGCRLVWPGSSWMTGSGTELLESSGHDTM